MNEKTILNDKSPVNEKSDPKNKALKYKSALGKRVLAEDSEYANAKIKIIQFIEES